MIRTTAWRTSARAGCDRVVRSSLHAVDPIASASAFSGSCQSCRGLLAWRPCRHARVAGSNRTVRTRSSNEGRRGPESIEPFWSLGRSIRLTEDANGLGEAAAIRGSLLAGRVGPRSASLTVGRSLRSFVFFFEFDHNGTIRRESTRGEAGCFGRSPPQSSLSSTFSS